MICGFRDANLRVWIAGLRVLGGGSRAFGIREVPDVNQRYTNQNTSQPIDNKGFSGINVRYSGCRGVFLTVTRHLSRGSRSPYRQYIMVYMVYRVYKH